MGELSVVIRTERLAFIGLLETLTPQQWATPSLCSEWTVQDVAAHLAWAPALPPAQGLVEMARAGFRVNKMIGDSAVRWSARGIPAILAQLRANAANGTRPPGLPEISALVDVVVHGYDVRRPLGVDGHVPTGWFAPMADFLLGGSSRWPLSTVIGGSARKRVEGVRVVAEDADWSHGTGPEARGTAETLLLLLTGRTIGADELTGSGGPALLRAHG